MEAKRHSHRLSQECRMWYQTDLSLWTLAWATSRGVFVRCVSTVQLCFPHLPDRSLGKEVARGTAQAEGVGSDAPLAF